MPVRFERRRAPIRDDDAYVPGSTVVDLTDLIEALVPEPRKDRGRRSPKTRIATPLGKRALRPPRQRRRQRRQAGQPLDDSAFFDPAQSDFAALVKKLDDVLDND
jgi:hypothetical protein